VNTDTIFAPATAQGRAAIAVLRISGPDTHAILSRLCRPPPPREARLRTLRAPSGETLDHALVLWFPAPATYTGEDAAELHLHAGPAILAAVAAALADAGARPAEPGEFTRRAFLAGKLDLTEAEAVADLSAAETDAQRRQAIRQLEGGLAQRLHEWSQRLTDILAHAESLIDFPDEDPTQLLAQLGAGRTALARDLRAAIEDTAGERLREGLVFAIAGPPNAGKSTLFNALAGRDAAIVAPTPGTTRDIIETRIVLGAVPVTLLDTAGLRDSQDPIENEGIARARARAAEADLVLNLHAANTHPEPIQARRTLTIATKTDLYPANTHAHTPADANLAISTTTGQGLPQLRQRLTEEATHLTQAAGPPPLTRARHRAALTEAANHLETTAELPELIAEDLRAAHHALARITGQSGVETILDAIFSRFCIGK
jgi:tRNA modification GTPase